MYGLSLALNCMMYGLSLALQPPPMTFCPASQWSSPQSPTFFALVTGGSPVPQIAHTSLREPDPPHFQVRSLAGALYCMTCGLENALHPPAMSFCPLSHVRSVQSCPPAHLLIV